MTFAYSLINNTKDTYPQRQECDDFWAFTLQLAQPDTRGQVSLEEYRRHSNDKRLQARWKAQKDGAAWIPSTFTQGGRRQDSDVSAVYAVPLDFDNGVDRAFIESRLNGYRYAAHTSYSHHPNAPKWRVVIPLAQPVPPAVFAEIWQHFNQLFDGKADPSGKNPSHLYYLPAVPPGGEAFYQQLSVDGKAFNPATLQPKATAQPSGAPDREADSLIKKLPADVQQLLREGNPPGERSEAIFKVQLALFRAGADDATAFSVLMDPRYALSEKCRAQGEKWLRAEITRARRKAAEKARPATDTRQDAFQRDVPPLEAYASDPQADASASKAPKKSQATQLIEIAQHTVLWHDAEGIAHASITKDDHEEHWPTRARGFKDWLCRRYWEAHKKSPSNQALADALNVIDGMARYDGLEHCVYQRVAGHEGAIYLDLCRDDWQAIAITAEGWRMVANPPVHFVRNKGMLPLPIPANASNAKTGTSSVGKPPKTIENLRLLWKYANVKHADDQILTAAWLVQALQPQGPYPVLAVQGEQGTAKSTVCRILRRLIDPSVADLRTLPKDERDLLIWACNGHIIALDNLSGLQPWLSDALCRMATGGGFSTRQLYSDTEEVLINVQRPVIANGIDDIATRQDLIDRCIILNLDPIAPDKRQKDQALWQQFEKDQPYILGALLTAVATALKNLPTTHLARLPRMADFAVLATAAEPVIGTGFLKAYEDRREEAIEAGLEGSPVAEALRLLVPEGEHWQGSATRLLAALENKVTESAKAQKSWPKSAKGLSGQLKRLAAALRVTGLNITQMHNGKERIIKLDWVGKYSLNALNALEASNGAASSTNANLTNNESLTNPNESLTNPIDDSLGQKPSNNNRFNATNANNAKIPTQSSKCTDADDGDVTQGEYLGKELDIEASMAWVKEQTDQIIEQQQRLAAEEEAVAKLVADQPGITLDNAVIVRGWPYQRTAAALERAKLGGRVTDRDGRWYPVPQESQP